jgi:hypothetical protein
VLEEFGFHMFGAISRKWHEDAAFSPHGNAVDAA